MHKIAAANMETCCATNVCLMKINFGEVIGFKLCCYYSFCRTL